MLPFSKRNQFPRQGNRAELRDAQSSSILQNPRGDTTTIRTQFMAVEGVLLPFKLAGCLFFSEHLANIRFIID